MSRINDFIQNINFHNVTEQAKAYILPHAVATAVGSAFTLSNPCGVAIGLVSKSIFTHATGKATQMLPEKVKKICSDDLTSTGLKIAAIAASFAIGHKVAHWAGYDTSLLSLILGTIGEIGYYLTPLFLGLTSDPFEKNKSEESHGSSILAITEMNFGQEVEESTLPVIVDVYATWCPPCRAMTPVFLALSEELKGQVKFAKFDIDKERKLGEKLGIQAMPTFLFFKNGKQVDVHRGALTKDNLKALINDKLLENPTLNPDPALPK